MGGFYGSVQVRGSDPETVRAAASAVASKMKIKSLVGPALNGWVGVYPENSGQDENVGERIAREVGGDVLHVLVHDDDIVAYWLWRRGKLVDSFHSKPGCFGEKYRAKEKKMRGNAAVFDWLAAPQRTELAKLLDREEIVVFEVERLEKFGTILGISNLITSYEYLKEGETDEIEGWEQFIEIPQAQVKKEQKKNQQQEEKLKNQSEQLKKSGALLVEETRKNGMAHFARAGDGIVLGWTTFAVGQFHVEPLRVFRSPWRATQQLDVELPKSLHVLASDPDGKFIGMTTGGNAVVYDANTWQRLLEIDGAEAHQLVLSSDGIMAHSNRHETAVTRVADAATILQTSFEELMSLAIHPAGWIVAGGNTLRIARLEPEAKFRELFVGGPSRLAETFWPLINQEFAKIDFVKMREESAKHVAATVKMLEKSGASLEQIEQFRQQMNKQIDKMQEAFAGKGFTPPPQGEERISTVSLSQDGRWLFCGTDKGMRIYEWETVAQVSGNVMPRARWEYDCPQLLVQQMPIQDHIYAIAGEPSNNGVIFGGLSGKIRRMDLSSGDVSELLAMPDGGADLSMLLSRDGRALATANRPSAWAGSGRRNDQTVTFRLWDYSALSK